VRKLWILGLLLAGCEKPAATVGVPGYGDARKSAASVRAERRAYDGAPPVVPHDDFKMSCTSCHQQQGISVPEVGFSPPMPHLATKGLSAISNCKQCHVFKKTTTLFKQSDFTGVRQDLRRGERLNFLAPPVLPHAVFMRENCQACHTGPAAREEIRCTHPERPRCVQCHVPQMTTGEFAR